LGETNALAWVNKHGLSENGKEPGSYALFGLFAWYFLTYRKYMNAFVVMFGLEGLSP